MAAIASALQLDHQPMQHWVLSSQIPIAKSKRAYRKLISQNHPDKLIGQGMPADMVKLATERTQEIQTAYELVVDSRK